MCSEFVMCYPPGIPILAPGERITAEILDYIQYAKAKGCTMTGPEQPDIQRINILTQVLLQIQPDYVNLARTIRLTA